MKSMALCVGVVLLMAGAPAAEAGPRTPEEAWRQSQGIKRGKRRKPARKRIRVTAPRRPLNTSTGPMGQQTSQGKKAETNATKTKAVDDKAGQATPAKGKAGPRAAALKKRIASAQASMAKLLRKVAARLEKKVATGGKNAKVVRHQQPSSGKTAGGKKVADDGKKVAAAGQKPPGSAAKAGDKQPNQPRIITASALLGDLRLHQFEMVSLETLGMLRTGRLVTDAEYKKIVQLRMGLGAMEQQLKQQSPPNSQTTQPPPSSSTTNPFDDALRN